MFKCYTLYANDNNTCSNAKEGKKAKVSLNKNITTQSEPLENKNVFKNFLSELTTGLVKK